MRISAASRIGEQGHVTDDGKFSWVEVECLGACVNAPMVQINADYYEDLTRESFRDILDAFAAGKTPKPGPQIDRQLSEPIGGATTLLDAAIYAKQGKAADQDTAEPRDGDANKPGVAANVPPKNNRKKPKPS